MRALLVALLVLLTAWPALAVNPDEMLADPALEARARSISANLRCLVCQNQSIDDSDADLAHDLRVIVRERLVAGDSDAEATQYIVDRYGEWILLSPRRQGFNLLVWLAPALAVVVGLGVVAVVVTRWTRRRPSRTAVVVDPAMAERIRRELESQP